ncbi:hypothetical protein [Roseiflexus castenholzii]|uniref:hypothetical protein n=1 Tax=Roseiflexus castenholzii TaxID=120962 RepID=UPI003C79C6D1
MRPPVEFWLTTGLVILYPPSAGAMTNRQRHDIATSRVEPDRSTLDEARVPGCKPASSIRWPTPTLLPVGADRLPARTTGTTRGSGDNYQ